MTADLIYFRRPQPRGKNWITFIVSEKNLQNIPNFIFDSIFHFILKIEILLHFLSLSYGKEKSLFSHSQVCINFPAALSNHRYFFPFHICGNVSKPWARVSSCVILPLAHFMSMTLVQRQIA